MGDYVGATAPAWVWLAASFALLACGVVVGMLMTKALQLLADREDQQAAQDDTAELFARVADLEQRCPYPVRACSPTSSEPVAVLAFDPEVNIGDTLPPPTWVEHAPPRHT